MQSYDPNRPFFSDDALEEYLAVDATVANLSSPQAEYFHGVTWRFIDANHHIQDWEWFKDGKQKEMLRMEFTRTK
ncbi:MAG: hypothetical protein IIB74_03190 [Proteobacteria bacterium]|nr:hypothetical protein [Pseudomonadota bacterium]MCH8099421.1 hypothetical protein [Pseudomonadota bacterium]